MLKLNMLYVGVTHFNTVTIYFWIKPQTHDACTKCDLADDTLLVFFDKPDKLPCTDDRQLSLTQEHRGMWKQWQIAHISLHYTQNASQTQILYLTYNARTEFCSSSWKHSLATFCATSKHLSGEYKDYGCAFILPPGSYIGIISLSLYHCVYLAC